MAKRSRPKPTELATVRITVVRGPRDGNTWYWRARTKGTDQRNVWSGWATREEAIRTVAGLEERGAFEEDEHATSARCPDTVGEVHEVWIKHQRRRFENSTRSPRTLEHYEVQARHLVKWLRDERQVRVSMLNRAILETYVADRQTEQVAKRRALAGRRARAAKKAHKANRARRTQKVKETKIASSPRTIRQEVLVLRMAYKWARETFRRFPQHDFPNVKVAVDEAEHVLNHYTPPESEIVAVLPHLSPRVRLMVEVLAETGARYGEAANATVGDLDTQRAELTLCGKTGPRVWSCSPRLADLLASAAKGRLPGARLVDLGVKYSNHKVLDNLEVACRAADVPRFTPHGLRRAAVRRARRRGIDVKVAASLFGHSEVVMLKLYDAVSDDERRAAVTGARMGILVDTENRVIAGPWKGTK